MRVAYWRFWTLYPGALAAYRAGVGSAGAGRAALADGLGPLAGCAPIPSEKREKAKSCCQCPLGMKSPWSSGFLPLRVRFACSYRHDGMRRQGQDGASHNRENPVNAYGKRVFQSTRTVVANQKRNDFL